MPHHFLAAITPFQAERVTDEPTAINGVRELTDDEWRRFREAVQHVSEFGRHQRLFSLFDRNIDAFFNFLKAVLNKATNEERFGQILMSELLLESDRHLLNMLTAFRVFTEHCSIVLVHTFGAESRQAKAFKLACSREYDTHFAYRFFYKLRNFAQHCGLPTGRLVVVAHSEPLAMRKSRRETSLSSERHEVSLQFDRDILLNSFDKWGTVASELRAKAPFIEVTSLVHRVHACIQRLARRFTRITAPRPRREARYLARLMTEVVLVHPNLLPIIIAIPTHAHRTPEKLHAKFHPFPVEDMIKLGVVQLMSQPG